MSEKKLHILLADDETEIAILVSSVLTRSGHTVDLAGDGKVAMNMLKDNPGRYDIVITDSNMPEVSGIQLIEHLRQIQYPGKIILLSGYVTSDPDEAHLGLNIDRIIAKPFSFSVLTKVLNELGAA